jgi:hypothetical protein
MCFSLLLSFLPILLFVSFFPSSKNADADAEVGKWRFGPRQALCMRVAAASGMLLQLNDGLGSGVRLRLRLRCRSRVSTVGGVLLWLGWALVGEYGRERGGEGRVRFLILRVKVGILDRDLVWMVLFIFILGICM